MYLLRVMRWIWIKLKAPACSLNYSPAYKPKTKPQENNKQKKKWNFTEEKFSGLQMCENMLFEKKKKRKYAQPHESFKKRKIKEHEMSPFAV